MIRHIVVGAAVLALAACTPGAGGTAEPSASPSVEYPTYEQQSARMALNISAVRGALTGYPFSYPETIPVVVMAEDAIHIGHESVPHPVEGTTAVIYGDLDDFCIEYSVANLNPSESAPVLASVSRYEDFEPTGCSAEYVAMGMFESPESAQPGFYYPTEIYPQAGVCFDKAVYKFEGRPRKESAWKVVDCEAKHTFEVYGGGHVDIDFFDLDDDGQWAWIAAQCAIQYDTYTPARDKKLTSGDLWRPIYVDRADRLRAYFCTGYYR